MKFVIEGWGETGEDKEATFSVSEATDGGKSGRGLYSDELGIGFLVEELETLIRFARDLPL